MAAAAGARLNIPNPQEAPAHPASARGSQAAPGRRLSRFLLGFAGIIRNYLSYCFRSIEESNRSLPGFFA